MDGDVIAYETLVPLSPVLRFSPDAYLQRDPCVVIRNQISMPSYGCNSSEFQAPNYFSLDLEDDEDDSNPSPVSGSASSTIMASEEVNIDTVSSRTMESGWFITRKQTRSPMLQLHKEIIDFCEFLSPTPTEQASRCEAVAQVTEVIKYIWPRSRVEVFGSFKTGLYLPTSDVDVVILGSKVETPKLGLFALSKALRRIAKNIKVIAHARVPIIKFVESRSGVSFDISFDMENGPKAAAMIKDALSRWPPLRPLCLIMKIFLLQRELNEVYSGGIGSYALITMLIAMLRAVQESKAVPEKNLGVLLVNFFDIYGRKLNTCDVGISCNGTATFFSKFQKGFVTNGRPFLISIQDPQAADNDVGKNSFNYFQVRSAFSAAFSALTNEKTILSLGPDRCILSTIIRTDSVIMRRKGGADREVTLSGVLSSAIPDRHPVVPLEFDDAEAFRRGGGARTDSGPIAKRVRCGSHKRTEGLSTKRVGCGSHKKTEGVSTKRAGCGSHKKTEGVSTKRAGCGSHKRTEGLSETRQEKGRKRRQLQSC